MLRQGPIPLAVHGLIEYAAAVLLIAAPFIFGFSGEGAATASSIAVGVVVLFLAAITSGPTSIVDSLPLAFHVATDYLLVVFLIAAPFIFGFSDESTPTVLFIALGIAHLLVTIGTRFAAGGTRVEDAPRG